MSEIKIVRVGCVLAGEWTRFYVGRPSTLGNRYSHKAIAGTIRVTTREAAIAEYRRWLDAQPPDSDARRMLREIADAVRAERRVALECHCAPLPCHAEVVREHVLALCNT